MILRTDPYGRIERLERWSARATLVILLGIVIETALLFWFPPAHAMETIVTASAHLLIGAGLAAEYVVILRAGAAHRAASGSPMQEQAVEGRTCSPEQSRAPRPLLGAAHRRRSGRIN